MSERDALLHAIRAAPDDDTPRLVYADWLDDHGHREHAEFIRLQLELEPIRHRLDDPRTRELIRHLDHLRPEWDRAVWENEPGSHWAVGLRRGLPDWAEIDLRSLHQLGDLRATYPTVRELAVFDFEHDYDRPADPAVLAGCPALAGLDVLELPLPVSPGDAAPLAESPHLAGVGTLRLWIGWSDPLAEALAAAKVRPARVELVQLLGGVSAGGRAAELDAQADALAARVNQLAGRELARVVRPFDRAFLLCGNQPGWDASDLRPGIDIGHGMFAGRLPDGTAALVFPTEYETAWAVARFDQTGRLTGVEAADLREADLPHPPQPPRRPTGLRGLLAGLVLRPPEPSRAPPPRRRIDHRWASDELGLAPAAIRVREFAHGPEFRVGLWRQSFTEPEDGPWVGDGARLYWWLKGENFAVGGHTADWRGRITEPTPG